MKQLILILGLAIMAVSCNEKNEDIDADIFVLLTPKNITINKETGGVVTVRTDTDAYVRAIVKMISEEPSDLNFELKSFFNVRPPEYLITIEDIMEYEVYEAYGCKVVPSGLQEYTIIVEPNCDYDAIKVQFARIYESKKYGKIGDYPTTSLKINLE